MRSSPVFCSNITHEIRHPIVGIISSAELLAGPGNAMDLEQEEYVRGIQQQSMQLLRLINDILEYAKLEGGYFKLNPKVRMQVKD
jgi:signal transduction histidine kinase